MIIPFAAIVLGLIASARAGLQNCKYSAPLTADNFDAELAAKGCALHTPMIEPDHTQTEALSYQDSPNGVTLAGPWDVLAQTFADEEGVLIAHVDADAAENKPWASKYGVQGFPTIKWFAKGAAPETYNSARSADALIEFVNKRTSSNRLKGGALDTQAGRIPSLDALVKEFLAGPTATRPSLIASASAVAASLNSTVSDGISGAAYYLRVLSKIATESTEDAQKYLSGEAARLAKIGSRKGAIAGKKLEELQIKQNILAAFKVVTGSTEEAVDAGKRAAEDAANRVKQEL